MTTPNPVEHTADPDRVHALTPLTEATPAYVPNHAPTPRNRDEWDIAFDHAVTYRTEHGHLRVPEKYTTATGFQLGRWLYRQRRSAAHNKLAPERVELLTALGIRWEIRTTRNWEDAYHEAAAYRHQHGHLNVLKSHRTDTGFALGDWLAKQRTLQQRGALAKERVDLLTALGIRWDIKARHICEAPYEEAVAYHHEHGHLNIPKRYRTPTGFGLGEWLATQRQRRQQGTLTQDRINLLNTLGMRWEILTPDQRFERGITAYAEWRAANPDGKPIEATTHNGFPLGKWLDNQRQARRRGTLTRDRVTRLDALDMRWEPLFIRNSHRLTD